MSERGVGVVERELLDRARAAEIARRRDHHRRLELVAELDRLGVAARTGDRGTDRLLQVQWNLDRAQVARLVDEAADLIARRSLQGEPLPPRLPCTAAVAAAGAVGPEHIAVVRRTMARLDRVDDLDPGDRVEAERSLAEQATLLPPAMLAKYAAALLARLDPDGVAPPEGEERCDELHVVRRPDGRLDFKGSLHDPVDGEVFLGTIDPLAEKLGPEDTRSLERRRAEALKEVVEHADTTSTISGPAGDSAAHGAAEDGLTEDEIGDDEIGDHEGGGGDEVGGVDADRGEDAATATAPDDEAEPALIPEPRRPEPPARPAGPAKPAGPGRVLVTLTMDHRWLAQAIGHGVLDSGALVHPHTVRRLACDAGIIPMVLGSRSEPLDVGRAQRTAPDAIRRALHLRDGGCAFPGCPRPPRRCQAHHLRSWLDGGDTAVDNMCLLCRFHHLLIHDGDWAVTMVDGRPWFTPPDWVDPERRPRPGGRPRLPA